MKKVLNREFALEEPVFCDSEVGETYLEISGEISNMRETNEKMGNYNLSFKNIECDAK